MSELKRILISGSSGLIGTALTDHLRSRGHEVMRLVRREPESVDEYKWDPYDGTIDGRAVKGVDVVVSLSGAGIGDRRWTGARKRLLYESRVTTTGFLARSLADAEEPPEVLISQSAIGIYGDREEETLTELSDPGPRDDFLVRLTEDWEQATAPARLSGVRVVTPRTGLVLDPTAQLLKRLVPLYKAGLGGPLGTGRQWWSWISLRDNVRAVEYLIDSDLSGPVNLVSPAPVRQKDFSRALAAALGRPSLVPVPRIGMSLALGPEKAAAIGLSSTRAVPMVLEESGFSFRDSELEATLRLMLETASEDRAQEG